MALSDLVSRGREREPARREEEEERAPASREQEMERWFEDFFRGFGLTPYTGEGRVSPRVDIDVVETENEIKVSAELPGMEQEDIDVGLSGNELTIRGEKKAEREEEGENYYRMERSYGSFRRSVSLPHEVDADQASASFRNGVLTVILPKAEEKGKRKIEVKRS
jgi:HSP20 family protein